MRRSRTQSDITSALASPPIEDLTRPEVHLPVDVPPDDLTEMHSVYGGGDESSVSLPNEAPFGAHQAPEADDLRIDAWTAPAPPPPTASPRVSTPSGPIVSPRPGAVTRVRTRTIAVEEDPTSGWSMPEARQPTMPPPSVIVATASTPPSVMVSPSIAPSVPVESWAPPAPMSWPAPAPAPAAPPVPTVRWRVAFDTGEAFVVEGLAVVGRRPEPRADEVVRHVVPLRSSDMSLSKTHAQFQVAPDGALVVMDRGSTNGSYVVRRGLSKALTAGRPSTLLAGDEVRFGDRTMRVEQV